MIVILGRQQWGRVVEKTLNKAHVYLSSCIVLLHA